MQKPDILSKYCLGMAAWLCCACCDCCVHLLQLRIARGRDSLRWTPRHRRHTADEGSWSKCNHEQLEPEVIMHKHTKLLHTGDQTMGTEPNTLLRTTHVFCVFCVLMTMNAETIVHTFKNDAIIRQHMCGLVCCEFCRCCGCEHCCGWVYTYIMGTYLTSAHNIHIGYPVLCIGSWLL